MGVRRRETLDAPVTPANIKYAARLRAEVQNAIARGTFDYAAQFPSSKQAKELAKKTKRHTVGELVAEYLDTARTLGTLSPSTIASYATWARHRITPAFGDDRVDEITTHTLRKWIVELSGELSTKSVRNCVGLLSAVLNRAAADGLIASSPLAPIKLRTVLPRKPKGDDDKIDPFNDSEVSAILGAAKTPEVRALFQFAFATGLRTGELIALKWSHIDWQAGTVHVTDNLVSGEHGERIEKDTKTGADRDVILLPAALEALATMKPITSMLRIGGYVFVNPNTRARWHGNGNIHDHWATTLRLAKVRYRNPYQTRHTFASRLLMAGEQELLVSKLLGHTTVEMVRRHYGRFIAQPEGIKLRGDYSAFGAVDNSELPQMSPKFSKTAR